MYGRIRYLFHAFKLAVVTNGKQIKYNKVSDFKIQGSIFFFKDKFK